MLDHCGYVEGEIPYGVSTATPTIRMLVVEAYAYWDVNLDGKGNGGWTTGSEVHPVIALRTTLKKLYVKNYPAMEKQPYSEYTTEQEFFHNGFTSIGTANSTEPLYLDSDGIITTPSEAEICNTRFGFCYEILVAPWNPKSDRKKLVRKLNDLELFALDIAKRKKSDDDIEAKRNSVPFFNTPTQTQTSSSTTNVSTP
jgi:hypothetical protein